MNSIFKLHVLFTLFITSCSQSSEFNGKWLKLSLDPYAEQDTVIYLFEDEVLIMFDTNGNAIRKNWVYTDNKLLIEIGVDFFTSFHVKKLTKDSLIITGNNFPDYFVKYDDFLNVNHQKMPSKSEFEDLLETKTWRISGSDFQVDQLQFFDNGKGLSVFGESNDSLISNVFQWSISEIDDLLIFKFNNPIKRNLFVKEVNDNGFVVEEFAGKGRNLVFENVETSKVAIENTLKLLIGNWKNKNSQDSIMQIKFVTTALIRSVEDHERELSYMLHPRNSEFLIYDGLFEISTDNHFIVLNQLEGDYQNLYFIDSLSNNYLRLLIEEDTAEFDKNF